MSTIEARNVPGTKDLFDQEAKSFRYVIDEAWNLAKLYNFSYCEVPILEFTEIFQRTMGETSDVVKKEIYNFIDRGERNIALRPEFTASIMRAVHSNKLFDSFPLKLFSAGPVFRYDRPQKGRQRQFNQINFEIIGTENFYQDAEMIIICMKFLEIVGIKNTKLLINSLGDSDTRQTYIQALTKYLTKYKDDLSEDSKYRLEKNPLRILDSKDKKDREILFTGPKIEDFYDSDKKNNFDKILCFLRDNNIDYTIDNCLVRGLDYYDYTVFEIVTEELGAQGTIIGGGRYNNLSTFFGNRQINCFGCAGGVERLMSLIKKEIQKDKKTSVLVLGEDNIKYGNQIAEKLREDGKICDLITGKDLKKLLVKANKFSFDEVIIIGNEEIKNKTLIVKNLHSGEQKTIGFEDW